jgi:hypothetical protein
MRILSTLVSLAILGYGGYWTNLNYPDLKTRTMEWIESGKFHTLEARFTAEQIMDMNRKVLLKDERHKFLTPSTKFSPYLLMEVKFTSNLETGEGIILWDLLDGEMVLNTNHWEKTHGFCDCINAKIAKDEFRVINTLSERGGILDRESLLQSLQVENDLLSAWLDGCRRKKLVVQTGSQYRLHLQKPRLSPRPQTIIDDRLVTKSYKSSDRLGKRFSDSQVKRIAEAAFGQDFAIRHTLDVYLPIYCITIENPDGSVHSSYWNALNGKQLPFTALLE